MAGSLIKFVDKVKIEGKSIFQVGINTDNVLLEDDSGYMVQETFEQILLEVQPNQS